VPFCCNFVGAEQLSQTDEEEIEEELRALLAEPEPAPKIREPVPQLQDPVAPQPTSEVDDLIREMEKVSLAMKSLPPPESAEPVPGKGKERQREKEAEDALLAN